MKNEQSKRREKINFPSEDRGWIALQERVIAIAGKPIEDLSPDEETAVFSVLRDEEKSALRNYLDRTRYCGLKDELARPALQWFDVTISWPWLAGEQTRTMRVEATDEDSACSKAVEIALNGNESRPQFKAWKTC